MALVDIYQQIKPSVVAFVPKYIVAHPKATLPKFPPIFGTGFIVREDGLIATNAHVMREFNTFEKPKGSPASEWGVEAMVFHMTSKGMVTIQLEVLGVFGVKEFKPGEVFYGDPNLDVAFVRVRARKLPPVVLDADSVIREGQEVATSGFPMGTRQILGVTGRPAQIGPTLQRGIISGVAPFPCAVPNGYVINVMVQGGASGSPVFDSSSGRVIGILHSRKVEPTGDRRKWQPTNFSLVLPSHYIKTALASITPTSVPASASDAKTLEEMAANASRGEHLDWIGGTGSVSRNPDGSA